MSVRKCKECKKEVSTKAANCPHCGAKAPKKTSIFTWLIVLLIVLFVISAYQNEANMAPEQKIARDKKRADDREKKVKKERFVLEAKKKRQTESDLKSKESTWIAIGQDAVKKRLKDSDSAKFKEVFFFRGSDNIPVACGKVNSKNSFGGYTGYKRFVSGGEASLTFIEGDTMDDFSIVWNRLCTGR